MTYGLLMNLLDMVVMIGIYSIAAISLNLEYGFTGLSNFGKVAFFMVGAYTYAILAQAGVNFGVCMVASAVSAAAFGFLVSLPALRLREDYLAIVTLTSGEILRYHQHESYSGTHRNNTPPAHLYQFTCFQKHQPSRAHHPSIVRGGFQHQQSIGFG